MRFPRLLEQKGAPAVSDRRSQPRVRLEHKGGIAFEIKAVDEEAHTFTGLAAAWSLDHGGDVIVKGAFKKTLDEWRAAKKQRPIPLIDQHGYQSVTQVLGQMIEAEETEEGLVATFKMLKGDPVSEAAFRRIKDGLVTGLSIGYETVTQRFAEEAERLKGIWRYLLEVKLREVSLVIWPMNDDARINTETAKQLLAKDRKELTDDERASLAAIRDQIDALLATDEDDETVDESAGKGAAALAPDDPKRLAMEHELREIQLRTLATA